MQQPIIAYRIDAKISSVRIHPSASPGGGRSGAGNRHPPAALFVLPWRADGDVGTAPQLARGGAKGRLRGAAIAPGSLQGSRLWLAITQAAAPSMPPGVKLPDEDIAVLREWIVSGAQWSETSAAPSWWAFRKPEPKAPPNVSGTANPIDAFVRANLAKQGLKPAPEADKLTLLRRLASTCSDCRPRTRWRASFCSTRARTPGPS